METLNTLSALALLGLILWAARSLIDRREKAAASGDPSRKGSGKKPPAQGARVPVPSHSAAALGRLPAPEEDVPLPLPWRICLWALVVLGLALRIFRFGAVPGGFNQDGAMAAVDALALARHGTDRLGTWLPAHFTAWGYGQMSVLLSYCMVPFFWLFGMDAVTARLPMLLWSLGGMGAAYALLRRLRSRRAALIGLLFLAICPWHFMQSRWALDCNVFPHAFLIGLALLLRGGERKAALYGSMVFFALCMYCYGLAFLVVPPFLLFACVLLLRSRRVRPLQALLCAGIYLLISFPIVGTMLINAMGWETVELPFCTMPYFPQSVRSGDLIFFSDAPWEQLRLNARALWNVGFLQGPDLPWNAIDGFGTVYRFSWPLGLLGLGATVCRAFRDEEPRRPGWRLLLLWWLCALALGLCVRQVNVNRINILFYVHALFVVLGIDAVLGWQKHSAWPILAVYALAAALFFHSYFGPWAQQIRVYFYEDFLTAVRCAEELEPETLIVTPDVQYTGSRAVSEILTLYALDLDDRYVRGESGETPAYRDRFLYRDLTPDDLCEPPPGAVWVQKTSALPEELPSCLATLDCGDYCVLYYKGG